MTAAGALELTAKAIAFHGSNAELMAAGCGTLRLLCVGHPCLVSVLDQCRAAGWRTGTAGGSSS